MQNLLRRPQHPAAWLTAVLLLAAAPAALAQGVRIGATGTPDAKAVLDLSATDRGLLIPRLTAAQRTAITSPPQGLMVYQTDGTASGGTQTGFWYYAGTPATWVYLSATATGTAGGDLTGSYPNPTVATGAIGTTKLADAGVTTAKLADNAVTSTKLVDDAVTIPKLAATGTASSTTYLRGDNTWASLPASNDWSLSGNAISSSNFIGTTNNQDLIFQRNGAEAFRVKANGSVSLGNNTPSSLSVALGFNCGTTLSSGLQNVFIGGRCAEDNNNNLGTFVGYLSGQHATGYGNTLLGGFAGSRMTTGDNNTIVGNGAVGTGSAGIGSGNVVLGVGAGNTLSNNNNNILIGGSSDASANLFDGYAFGNNAFVTQGQSLVIGNTTGTNDAINVGIGVQAPHSTLQVDGTFAVGVVADFAGGGSGNARGIDQGRNTVTTLIGGYYGLNATGSTNQYYALPNATTCKGRIYYLRNNGGTTPILSTLGGSIFVGNATAGSSTYTMTTTNRMVMAISDGTNWYVSLLN